MQEYLRWWMMDLFLYVIHLDETFLIQIHIDGMIV